MPVQTRSMTKAARAAEAVYFDALYKRTRQAAKKEAIDVANILVEMSTGALTRVNEACALDGVACCYMEDKRPFIREGFKEIRGYEDGVGTYTKLALHWIHYCPPCQYFWKNRGLRRSARVANKSYK